MRKTARYASVAMGACLLISCTLMSIVGQTATFNLFNYMLGTSQESKGDEKSEQKTYWSPPGTRSRAHDYINSLPNKNESLLGKRIQYAKPKALTHKHTKVKPPNKSAGNSSTHVSASFSNHSTRTTPTTPPLPEKYAKRVLYWGNKDSPSRDTVLAKQLQSVFRLKTQNYYFQGWGQPATTITEGMVDGERICMPNLFFAGFPKTGSTMLYSMLMKHRQVLGGVGKENHFLTKSASHVNGTSHILQQFYNYAEGHYGESCRDLLYDKKARYLVEGTQSISWNLNTSDTAIHDVPLFLKTLVPHAKFVFLKKTPLLRDVSDYHFYRDSESKNAFDKAAESDVSRMDQCLAATNSCCCAYFPPEESQNKGNSPRMFISLYDCHIARVKSLFPPEQVLELSGHVDDKMVGDLFAFLGLKSYFDYEDLRSKEKIKIKINKNKHPKPSNETATKVKEFYAKWQSSELVQQHGKAETFRTHYLMQMCKR